MRGVVSVSVGCIKVGGDQDLNTTPGLYPPSPLRAADEYRQLEAGRPKRVH